MQETRNRKATFGVGVCPVYGEQRRSRTFEKVKDVLGALLVGAVRRLARRLKLDHVRNANRIAGMFPTNARTNIAGQY